MSIQLALSFVVSLQLSKKALAQEAMQRVGRCQRLIRAAQAQQVSLVRLGRLAVRVIAC